MLTLANTSSPKIDFAYKFAAIKPQSPDKAFSGVKHFMFVDFMICSKYSFKSFIFVLTTTLFSHSNSTHICKNSWSTTQFRSLVAPLMSYTIFPKIMPFSVEATFMLALMLVKSLGARVSDWGFSTSFKSPRVASSRVRF
ncbi:hypothetical protein BpHYR1_041019 [Brachionus plicatilis]|uniref:Uncharacterized protein n=1 Tax=Brachionus plicatilis TaxID=10195 RepID=A0A3M7R2K3_BRAPC|nr:hypothetical protein BpHYR1_041019 [Brachionus plicatilis]